MIKIQKYYFWMSGLFDLALGNAIAGFPTSLKAEPLKLVKREVSLNDKWTPLQGRQKNTSHSKQTKLKDHESVPKSYGYQNQSYFSSVGSGPFPATLFPSFYPVFPLQAMSPLLPLSPSSPPLYPPFLDSWKALSWVPCDLGIL